MDGTAHLKAGVVTGIALDTLFISNNILNVSNIYMAVPVVALTTAFALFPDLDSTSSYLGRRVPFLSRIITHIFGHRGLIHTPYVYVIAVLLLSFKQISPVLNFAIYSGCISHLVLDSVTKRGIPLFYPFNKKKFHVIAILMISLLSYLLYVYLFI